MAIDELILDHLDAGNAAGCDEMISVRVIRRFIYIRKKLFQGFCDRKVGPVEKADNAVFTQRIRDLLLLCGIGLALPR